MPTTSPDSIYYADGTTPASLADITSAMATSVQNAMNLREAHNFSWPNTAARTAQTGMATGDIGYQIDTGVFYIYSGSAWRIWEKAPATYTPTFVGFSSTVFSFTYSIAAGFVRVIGKATLSSAVTATMTISTPSGFNIDVTSVGAAIPASQIGFGGVDGATDHPLGVRVSTSSTVALSAFNAAGTYLTVVNTAAAIPLTWAIGNILYVSFTYPVV
jgi:hypothetical protein